MSSPNAGAVSAAQQAETVPVSTSHDQQEGGLKKEAATMLEKFYAETGTYQVGMHTLASSRRFLMEELQKGIPTWCARDASELALWLEARRAKLHSLYNLAWENFSQARQRMAAAAEGLSSEKAQAKAAAIEAAEHLLMSDKRRQELDFLQKKLEAVAATFPVNDSPTTD